MTWYKYIKRASLRSMAGILAAMSATSTFSAFRATYGDELELTRDDYLEYLNLMIPEIEMFLKHKVNSSEIEEIEKQGGRECASGNTMCGTS